MNGAGGMVLLAKGALSAEFDPSEPILKSCLWRFMPIIPVLRGRDRMIPAWALLGIYSS